MCSFGHEILQKIGNKGIISLEFLVIFLTDEKSLGVLIMSTEYDKIKKKVPKKVFFIKLFAQIKKIY